jgi:hypothetical protein
VVVEPFEIFLAGGELCDAFGVPLSAHCAPALHAAVKPRSFVSHETVCLLNADDADAHVELTLYFADREPVGPYRVTVPARLTLHLRFNDLADAMPVPRGRDDSSVTSPTCPSWCSTRDSTRGRISTRCGRRWRRSRAEKM